MHTPEQSQDTIRSSLEECCDNCEISYTAEDTNSDLCTEIYNYSNP